MGDIDYGLLGGLVAGGQGFIKGMQDSEDRKFKRMEFEAKYKADQTEKDKKKAETSFNNAGKLRDDWLKNQTTKNSQSVKEAFDKIKSAPPSAAGDMSLIYGIMKMQDPGSTVRESEFASAQMATGAAQKLQNLYKQVMTGQRLNPEQRKDFMNTAGQIYGAQQKSQGPLDEQFRGLSTTYGINPNEVVLKIFTDPQTGEQKVVSVPSAPAKPKAGLLKSKPSGAGLVKKGKGGPSNVKDIDHMSDDELKAYLGQ